MLTDNDFFDGVDEADRCCMRCGRHISELKHFDDPEYSGLTVFPNRRFLNYVEKDEKLEEILTDIAVFGVTEDLCEFHGTDNIRNAMVYDDRRGWVEKILECKDCWKEEGDYHHYTWGSKNKDELKLEK